MRNEVPVDETWDLASLFEHVEQWKEAKSRIQQDLFPELMGFQGRLGDGPELISLFFEKWKFATALMDKVFYYAIHSRSVNLLDKGASSLASEARSLMDAFSSGTSFYLRELKAQDPLRLSQWVDEDANKLQFLRPLLLQFAAEDGAAKDSVFDHPEAMAKSSRIKMLPVYNALLSEIRFEPALDSDHAEIPLSLSSIAAYLNSPDPEIRRTVWQSQADGLLRFQNSFASIYAAHLNQEYFRTELVNGMSNLSVALARRRIPEELFHGIISAFHRNLGTFHRYFQVLCKYHRVEKLSFYDLTSPLSKHPSHVSFARAVEMICEALSPFGHSYIETVRKGCFEDRWIDRALNHGKQSGSFSFSADGMLPFVFLSYADDVRSMSNLAHELGHSMHYVLTRESQHRLYHSAGTLLDEVPSHVHQTMLRCHLLATASDPDLRLAVIVDGLRLYFNYFFLIPILCEFELQAHSRIQVSDSVSAASLSSILVQLFRAGFGPHVEIDEARLGIQWARYNALFYSFSSFSYSTGIAVADALVPSLQAIRDPEAITRYMNLLKSGSTKPPLVALLECGVDLRSPDTIQSSYDQINFLIDQLEVLLPVLE